MSSPQPLDTDRFPRSSKYHPDWVMKNGSGANALWLAEWLTADMQLRPGMRVLDLGCGNAISPIFLAREFGLQVWATDLWATATENFRRIQDAGLADQVFPLHCDARSLPFAGDFFDAIICIDSFFYFGTDLLYLNYLANFVKADGQIGIAGAGLTQEFTGGIPTHLASFWSQDCWALHSPDWLRDHWGRTGIVDVEVADVMPEGWKVWLDWQTTAWPKNEEIATLREDAGRYLAYVRAIGRKRAGVQLAEYCWPDPLRSMPTGGESSYEKLPLLRDE